MLKSNQVHLRRSSTHHPTERPKLLAQKNHGLTNLAISTPSPNFSTSNRTLSPPCSITTPSPSTATNLTPGLTRSPCKKLLGGPSFKLKIATAPRLPAITPLTLISTGAVRLENHCSAGLSLRAASSCGVAAGVWDSAMVRSRDDQVAMPTRAASSAVAWMIWGGEKRAVNLMG
ncbi:hypothetical protein EMIT0P2_10906 [Pseudomonas sp. IT-P2]